LIADIDLGKVGLPDLQRPFVWKNVKVRNLFDSLYRVWGETYGAIVGDKGEPFFKNALPLRRAFLIALARDLPSSSTSEKPAPARCSIRCICSLAFMEISLSSRKRGRVWPYKLSLMSKALKVPFMVFV